MDIQAIQEEMRTPVQKYRDSQKKRIVSEFTVLKDALIQTTSTSNQAVINLLARKYNISSMTVRRYLQEAEAI